MERERTDLRNRDDVLTLVTTFYRRAFDDELLGPIFVDVARMDLAHHLPIICDFWETVLFQAGLYRRNALQIHLSLNARAPLGAPHFERWLRLWTTTVDDAFAGEKAELAKTQAARIAGSIQRRLQGRSGSDFETLRTGPDAAGARQRAAGGTG
jgi:hemoglobin